MKVTYNWLKDFVEINIPAQALADKLTMAGLEVTSLENKEGDFVLELEVTSNRADCLSVIGIAREVAAITKRKLRAHSLGRRAQSKKLNTKTLKIEIENKKDCPLYTAKIIQDVKVGPSGVWLKKRLELIGCRSINNIVDITNYILFTRGQPLHAFDLDKLDPGKIIVRRAQRGERLTTIDRQERLLDEAILVIADKTRPLAIAGIMGGQDSEVSENSKNILLEAAVFNPILVRRGNRSLGLQSDSSYRFERGVDLEQTEVAAEAAVELIEELSGGSCVLAKSSTPPKIKAKEINLDLSFVQKILGINIAPDRIKKILESLGFLVKAKGKNCFLVKIPSYRGDINLEIDLIEEIARIFGYGHVPVSLPLSRPQLSSQESKGLVPEIKNILVGLGLNEAITYSLIDRGLLAGFALGENSEASALFNPLSKEQEILRPQLMPSLCRCVSKNLNQRQDYINIFEIAKIFRQCANETKEELTLGIALSGMKSMLLEQGLIKDKVGFLHLKGILETLFKRLGIQDYDFVGRDAHSVGICVGKERVGIILGLGKKILEAFDIKNREVWTAEVSLERLLNLVNLKRKFTPLPLYPGISRDISLILKEDILIGEILKAIKEKGRPLLEEVKIIDYYKGKQIPCGYKGLTLSCFYRSGERTLTEAEVNPLHSEISSLLAARFLAQIRA